MKSHSLRKMVGYSQEFVKPLRKKADPGSPEEGDRIYTIGPIDQQPAPGHHRKYREIDPVRPADQQGMFFFDDLHLSLFVAHR